MYEYLERRYARAIYEVAEGKNKVEEYISELSQVMDILSSDSNFQLVVSQPQISTSNKIGIFNTIFKGRISEDTLSFLLVLIEKDRVTGLAGIIKSMKLIKLEKENTVVAKVKTVIPLQDEERILLKSKLSNMYNKKILLDEELDESILGGVFVRVGDDIIDGTVKSKLTEMKRLMLKRE
ncbi:MAG TPA: F0F1 ATP synthase subunit delta [Clostridiaceae bacterium]